MSSNDQNKKQTSSSVEFMLKEFSYVQESEFYNRKNGDTRFNYYLTFISLISVGLLTFWSTIDQQSTLEIAQFNILCFCCMAFVFFLGWNIFTSLINRWRLTVIYLRKMARIRKWFLDIDPQIRGGLVNGYNDTQPLFSSKRFFSSNLIILITVFNCISFAILAFQLIGFFSLNDFVTYFLVLISIATMLSIHYCYYQNSIKKFEKDKYIAFPDYLVSTNDQKKND